MRPEMPSIENGISAEQLRRQFQAHQASYDLPMTSQTIESKALQTHDDAMNDITREEVKARLEASEARVATIVESIRANTAELRAELRESNAQIKAQGEVAKASAATFQAEADKFYADARTLLAESRTALSEIRLAGEQNKNAMMGMGYKVITWTLGTILAVGGVSIGAYNAIKRSPAAAPPPAAQAESPKPQAKAPEPPPSQPTPAKP